MDSKKKLKEEAKAEEFFEKIFSCENKDQIKEVLKEYNVDLSDKEIDEIKNMRDNVVKKAVKSVEKLNLDEMRNVSGGNKGDSYFSFSYLKSLIWDGASKENKNLMLKAAKKVAKDAFTNMSGQEMAMAAGVMAGAGAAAYLVKSRTADGIKEMDAMDKIDPYYMPY